MLSPRRPARWLLCGAAASLAIGLMASGVASGAAAADSSATATTARPLPPVIYPKEPVKEATIGARFACVAAPANEPAPPPLPASARLDRIEAGLDHPTALCPEGQEPEARPSYVPKEAAPLPAVSSVTCQDVTDSIPNCIGAAQCPGPPTYPHAHYCHEIEAKDKDVSDIGMIASFNLADPKVPDAKSAPHSITQLWAVEEWGKDGESTLETGWSVSPKQWGDSKPHLFEFHTGDSYGADSCYDACGFHGVRGAPVVAGERIASKGVGTFGVELYKGRWWFYYGGFWYGYIAQNDKSWEKHPIKRFTIAEAGGEISGPSACPAVQMGNGKFGPSATAAAVRKVLLLSAAPKLSSKDRATVLVPTYYYSEGNNGRGGSRYVAGRFDPAAGAFGFGGPGGCNKK
jgi:hypothetical protein